jgi:hypothetical protein
MAVNSMSYYISIVAGPVFSANPVPSGATFSFTYAVKNTGDAPAINPDDTVRQGLYVGYRFTNSYGRVVAEDARFFDKLAPGESASGTESLSFSSAETFTLTLMADPGRDVAGIGGAGRGDTATGQLTVVEAEASDDQTNG